MTEGGVLVQRHLGVERVHVVLRRQDQRVDLGEVAVALGVALVEVDEQFGGLFARDLVEFGVGDPTSRGLEVEPANRVDREEGDRVGVLLGDDLDLDAALGAQHAEVRLVLAVQRERGVVLLGDVARALDPESVHDVTFYIQSEDVAGVQSQFVDVVGQLHAAGLAATADLHLGLDDDGIADALGDLDGLSTVSATSPGETAMPKRAKYCLP